MVTLPSAKIRIWGVFNIPRNVRVARVTIRNFSARGLLGNPTLFQPSDFEKLGRETVNRSSHLILNSRNCIPEIILRQMQYLTAEGSVEALFVIFLLFLLLYKLGSS